MFTFPADVEGYTSEAETQALYTYACQAPDGAIVELGTYKGRSAVSLAQSGREVYAVDRFQPEPEGLHFFNGHPDHHAGRFSASLVDDAARRYGVHVTVISDDSAHAGQVWDRGPVALLFIDAGHEYDLVKADFEAWERHVIPDGIVVFDDTLWPGVMRFLMELRDWTPVIGQQVGGLTAMQRIKE